MGEPSVVAAWIVSASGPFLHARSRARVHARRASQGGGFPSAAHYSSVMREATFSPYPARHSPAPTFLCQSCKIVSMSNVSARNFYFAPARHAEKVGSSETSCPNSQNRCPSSYGIADTRTLLFIAVAYFFCRVTFLSTPERRSFIRKSESATEHPYARTT